MRWHCPAGPRAQRRKKKAGIFVLPTFGQANKPHRINQETEVYINLYYTSRITPVFKERLAQHEHKGPAINLVRQVAREMYDNEDNITRGIVAAAIASQAEAKADEDKILLQMQMQEQVQGPTPQDIQQ